MDPYTRDASGPQQVARGTHGSPPRRRKAAAAWMASHSATLMVLGLVLSLAAPAQAAFVNFQDCLSPAMIAGNSGTPKVLQFNPFNATASLNLTDPANVLNITIYGNVSGQSTKDPLQPWNNNTYWNTSTNGKIVNQTGKLATTVFPKLYVLNYKNYAGAEAFCNTLLPPHVCPLGPVFNVTNDTTTLPAFSIAHPMEATYGFTTINAQFNVVRPDVAESPLACILINITPYIGHTAQILTTYLPLIILVLVAIATTCAALFSPWGTWDIFRATSNYGREVRLLRLMTPGFGDCLNYLQFIVLTGSLSLDYPGFFQPIVSNVAWSALMFNQSFVTHGPGSPLTVDGIYVANGTYGLDVMSQLVGMTDEQDLWAGMMIWLLVVIAAIVLLIQVAFGVRWAYRFVSKTHQEDLRAKNVPFSVGNAVRVVFNYFLLPIVALSMFQLVTAGSYITLVTPILAAVTILLLLGFAGWLIWIIIQARPRSFLFDDLRTVLLYGPLYNTYSDSAAPFALVSVITTFIRGVAIGAVQSSGIAQIVLLAICEVIFMLTLNAFRPFFSGTYMNFINTMFSIARLIIVLLMVSFVPTLGVNAASKGYIAYVILILHALVLFAGFFLRVISTLLELIARAAGAGEDSSAIGGFARVLGLRQLTRRNARDAARSRASYASNATMLAHGTQGRDLQSEQRSRSMSASSGLLLNNHAGRQSVALESASGIGGGNGNGNGVAHSHTGSGPGTTPSTVGRPGSASAAYAFAGGAGTLANLRGEPADPYFRAPRPRRTTFEMQSPDPSKEPGFMGSGDWEGLKQGPGADAQPDSGDLGEAGLASVSGRGTPMTGRDNTDSFDERRPKPDYATREVDYYYGVRGPALSHMPTRRLKTGPADPTGPVSSATGWFRGLFGGKTKESGKGFEVVRSARMPPQMEMEEKDLGTSTPAEPYTDEPESSGAPTRPRHFALDDEGDAVGGGTRYIPGETRGAERGRPGDGEDLPQLPDIDAGGSINMPSRWNSTASAYLPAQRDDPDHDDADLEAVPEVPRKSSRRDTSAHGRSLQGSTDSGRLSIVPGSPPDSPDRRRRIAASQSSSLVPPNRDSIATSISVSSSNWPIPARSSTPQRMPFGSTLDPADGRRDRHERAHSTASIVSAVSDVSRTSDVSALSTAGTGARDSTSVRGGGRRDASGGSRATGGGSRYDSARGRGDTGALTPGFDQHGGDRPSSIGFVQQHRASDGIHVVTPSENTLTGSSAEFLDAEERASSAERRR